MFVISLLPATLMKLHVLSVALYSYPERHDIGGIQGVHIFELFRSHEHAYSSNCWWVRLSKSQEEGTARNMLSIMCGFASYLRRDQKLLLYIRRGGEWVSAWVSASVIACDQASTRMRMGKIRFRTLHEHEWLVFRSWQTFIGFRDCIVNALWKMRTRRDWYRTLSCWSFCRGEYRSSLYSDLH